MHAHLDVGPGHLPLEGLLQGEQRSVYRILELQVIGVALLQESFRVDHVLADCRGLPSEERSGRIDLV